ncbi:MAG: hypothetical protein M1822_001053 [Bathelium mastoideum]|nr:MAG: hypothetical protein M1822_001053 [Bathelium mastoideum]
MANVPPPSPSKKGQRPSLLEQFPGLDLGSSRSSEPSSLASSRKAVSCLKGSFNRGWPPSILTMRGLNPAAASSSSKESLKFTLRMSQDYRVYDDRWRVDSSVKDQPTDVSESFRAAQEIMTEVSQTVKKCKVSPNDVESVMLEQMCQVIFGSNQIERVGLGLNETLSLCQAIFRGEQGVTYSERTEAYQAKLDALIKENVKPGDKPVLRSRREVVQHAAAFQHLVSAFVKNDRPMTEELIKKTHEILTNGLSGEDACVFNTQSFGGTYRKGTEQACASSYQFTKPADIPKAMRSMVNNLQNDLAEAERSGYMDPFMLAARYCDRMVNIHPFKDGNGRMCRLMLNAILMKYAGVVPVRVRLSGVILDS